MPTAELALACVRVCQSLSNGFQVIHLFRYGDSTQTVYILAGKDEGIEVIIQDDGSWYFP